MEAPKRCKKKKLDADSDDSDSDESDEGNRRFEKPLAK
jgi:hypothetical protein